MLFWNKQTLSVVVKRSAAKSSLRLTFDGKNGKNAFVSFADKMLDFVDEKDSIHVFENDRAIQDSIIYTQKPW